MRRSRSVLDALLTAAAAAFSQESVLVPTSSITLYTLSGMAPPSRKRASRPLLYRFEQPGRSHPAADAHGDDAVALLLAAQLEQDRAGHARPGHAVGMADRDRAAVRVELRRVEAEPVAAVDDLRGEGLVQLDDVDVVELEARHFQALRDREHGPDAHL